MAGDNYGTKARDKRAKFYANTSVRPNKRGSSRSMRKNIYSDMHKKAYGRGLPPSPGFTVRERLGSPISSSAADLVYDGRALYKSTERGVDHLIGRTIYNKLFKKRGRKK